MTRDIVSLVAIGMSAGIITSIALLPALRVLLYDVTAADPFVFGVAPVVLLLVCSIAAWIPTYRAIRINAAAALRYG